MVSERIKNVIAATGLVAFLTGIGVDKYLQSKSREIQQHVPGVQRIYDIEGELLKLIDKLKNHTVKGNYTIDSSFIEKYQTLTQEYSKLTSQETIKNAREQITSNYRNPAFLSLWIIGVLGCGYAMWNQVYRKKNEEEPPKPAEAVTTSDADY